MVDANVSLAVLVLLLAAADLVLLAGLMSDRAAAVTAAAVGRSLRLAASAAGRVRVMATTARRS